jgi:hypothetical protein
MVETASMGRMVAGMEGGGEQAYGELMNDNGGGAMGSEQGQGLDMARWRRCSRECVDSKVDVLSWHEQVIIELLGWLEECLSIGEDSYMFSGSLARLI